MRLRYHRPKKSDNKEIRQQEKKSKEEGSEVRQEKQAWTLRGLQARTVFEFILKSTGGALQMGLSLD